MSLPCLLHRGGGLRKVNIGNADNTCKSSAKKRVTKPTKLKGIQFFQFRVVWLVIMEILKYFYEAAMDVFCVSSLSMRARPAFRIFLGKH